MNGTPLNGLSVPDAHAHGVPGENDELFRLWNIGDPAFPVPDTFFFSAGIHPWDAGKYELAAFAPCSILPAVWRLENAAWIAPRKPLCRFR